MPTNLKVEMTRRGLRQTRVAAEIGMNVATFNAIVNGYARPRPGQLAALTTWAISALNCEPDSVMDLLEEATR
jgi:transcriptional regulator with XRE-family HTH domain